MRARLFIFISRRLPFSLFFQVFFRSFTFPGLVTCLARPPPIASLISSPYTKFGLHFVWIFYYFKKKSPSSFSAPFSKTFSRFKKPEIKPQKNNWIKSEFTSDIFTPFFIILALLYPPPIVHHTWERKTIESFSSIYIFVLAAKSRNGPADTGAETDRQKMWERKKNTRRVCPSSLSNKQKKKDEESFMCTASWLYVLIHFCVCVLSA